MEKTETVIPGTDTYVVVCPDNEWCRFVLSLPIRSPGPGGGLPEKEASAKHADQFCRAGVGHKVWKYVQVGHA